MNYLLFFVLFVCSHLCFAQDFTKYGWNAETIAQANTAKDVSYMTEEEKKVIEIMNLARMKPAFFAETIGKIWKDMPKVDSYISVNLKTNTWYLSLLRDLKKTKPTDPLYPNEELKKAAEYHAKDMGKSGRIGHNSSNGTSFEKRMKKFQYVGENCDYGYNRAIDIVMHLLIDEGVPSLGHRYNILNRGFYEVGVSIQEHKKYNYNTVIDFSE